METASEVAALIPVKVLPLHQLRAKARQDFIEKSNQSISGTDIGIIVAFIRHTLTPYDKMMDETRSRKSPEAFEQRNILRRAIHIAIAKAYAHQPAIVHEAERLLNQQMDIAKQSSIRTWRAPN